MLQDGWGQQRLRTVTGLGGNSQVCGRVDVGDAMSSTVTDSHH